MPQNQDSEGCVELHMDSVMLRMHLQGMFAVARRFYLLFQQHCRYDNAQTVSKIMGEYSYHQVNYCTAASDSLLSPACTGVRILGPCLLTATAPVTSSVMSLLPRLHTLVNNIFAGLLAGYLEHCSSADCNFMPVTGCLAGSLCGPQCCAAVS